MRGAARTLPFTGMAAAGVLHAFAVAWPWGGQPIWWLQVLALGALAFTLHRETSVWRAGALGWVFAIGWLCATFWWLYISMHIYGGLPAPLAVAAIVGLAAFLGLYYAGAAAAFVRWRPGGAFGAAALFAALWLLAEWLRGVLFTGFPWGAAGYAHVDGPLVALAPWVGVYGIGALSAFVTALASTALAPPQRKSAAIAGAAVVTIVTLANLLNAPVTQSSGTLSLALLQGNIPQDEKFQGGTGIPIALQWYGDRLLDSPVDLVVAPETAIPLLPQQLPDDYLPTIRAPFRQGQRAALTGMPLGSFAEGYTNSIVGWKPGDPASYRYDKHHLVPFGEFIPPLFKWFTRMMNIPLGDFNRGGVGQPSFEWKGQRLAPNVCYEDLFGEELGARFRDPATAPTIFVNFSNIGWFGNTVAIDQHLHISRMRALEFERPMVRATNTGATVVIDHKGRVTDSLPRHTRGVLLAQAEGRDGITPYAWWVARFGLWPFVFMAVAIVGHAVWRRRRAP